MKTVFTTFKLTAIVALGFLTSTASAQSANPNTISYGIKGGIQWNNYSVFALQGENRMTAFNAGFTGIFSSNEHWAIGSDLLYSRNGSTYTVFVPENNPMKRTVFTDYIRLNPKAYYFFGSIENRFRPKITLGPSIGVLVLAKNNVGTSYRSDYQPMDFGGVIGTGFNYRLSPAVWFNMDVEYMMGLTNVNKKAVNSPANGLKNNSFMVDLGLSVGLSRIDK